ncbi:unnamed protein product [Arctogadus glacialis]
MAKGEGGVCRQTGNTATFCLSGVSGTLRVRPVPGEETVALHCDAGSVEVRFFIKEWSGSFKESIVSKKKKKLKCSEEEICSHFIIRSYCTLLYFK